VTLEQVIEIVTTQCNQLNKKQKEAVNLILNKLDNNSYNNHCYYIGPGGSGKMFIYTTIYYLAKIRNKRI